MKRRLVLLIGLLFSVSACTAPDQKSFTDQQKSDIQQIVHDYLLEKPELLIEVSQKLQLKEQVQQFAAIEAAIVQNKDTIFDNTSPISGSPNGTVNIVEFFDYQCGHCQKMAPLLTALRNKDKNVRVLYKELPIFGDVSTYASKAALAANLQQKYQPFHDALMAAPRGLTNEQVLAIAKTSGLDVDKLQKDMNSPAIETALTNNKALADTLGINATPAFIITTNPPQLNNKDKMVFMLGEIPGDKLQQLVRQVQQ